MEENLRRMKSKLGPAAATTATAHKIAIIFYMLVNKQVEYDAMIWAQRDAQHTQRLEANSNGMPLNWATNGSQLNKTCRLTSWIKRREQGVLHSAVF
jgi:hypothetical protein